MMDDFISLDHGSGGKKSYELISKVFAARFGMGEPFTDSAVLNIHGDSIAFTTDSYVVDPLFFPGGNIGKLALCGTVNDLAVSGAIPLYISASFIIEEGFPLENLKSIAESMAEEALKAGVRIVTGDTKVVGKGKCDGLFITTSGTGVMPPEREHISSGRTVKEGDKLLINGSPGNHAIAVLGARNNLSFTTPVLSDCASLNHMIENICRKCSQIRFMRDLTRGGLAGILNELSAMTGKGILVDEANIPVDEPVKGACEILGFDPLYLANEGKILIVTGAGTESEVLEVMRSHPPGRSSEIIGEVIQDQRMQVILNTVTGGKRILDMPAGIQLPRIC